MNEHQKNADRFTGFADIYEKARPKVPEYPVKIICKYLGKKPDTVVDLGCGTGLSTVVWKDIGTKIIGIEPSDDMLAIAGKKSDKNISFIKGYSDSTGLEDKSADVVICSQSFHWMEPISALKEINRILKSGGVFAAVDCDWPPGAKWQAEQAYMKLYSKVKRIEADNKEIHKTFVRYDKAKHLQNIKSSGYFRYCREILFASTEKCNAQRFINIILSQGSLQTILKLAPDLINDDVVHFKNTINKIYGDETFDIDFYYRMRIGIK